MPRQAAAANSTAAAIPRPAIQPVRHTAQQCQLGAPDPDPVPYPIWIHAFTNHINDTHVAALSGGGRIPCASGNRSAPKRRLPYSPAGRSPKRHRYPTVQIFPRTTRGTSITPERGYAQIIDDQLRDVHETPGRRTALQAFVVVDAGRQL